MNKGIFVAQIFMCVYFVLCINKAYCQAPQADSLAMYRLQIDSLDKQLIEILGKRMQVVEAVGSYKAVHNIAPLQKARFDAILQKNIQMGKAYNLSPELITEIMNAIHKESLAKETVISGGKTGGN